MADASNVQTSFLSGEWSPYAQGELSDPEYKRGMNVCRNAHPIETGACPRRVGTRFLAFTRKGQPGKLIPFSFTQTAPYQMEFTEGKVRLFDSQGLVMAEAPRVVLAIDGGTPAQITTLASGTNWATGDTVVFDFPAEGAPTAAGILLGNQYSIVMGADQTHFTITDATTGVPVNGVDLGWTVDVPIQVSRIFELNTPYVNGSWATLRGVQDNNSVLLLNKGFQPYSMFAATDGGNGFTLNPAQFTDGPYLDAPTDGSFLIVSGKTGTITATISYPNWDSTVEYPDGSRFFAATQRRAGLTSTSAQYTNGSVVLRSGATYVSIQDNNLNHDPAVSPLFWKMLTAGAIVGGVGFQATDVGRSIRLHSQPDEWVTATSYSIGDLVLYQGAYWASLINSNSGHVPGADTTSWGTASNADIWTWGIITIANNAIEATLQIMGPDLLYTTNVHEWRMGAFSNSTTWPACGTFHEGRFWLGGAIKNRFDASKADGNTYDFTPTGPDGTVADDNAISYILNSPQQNLIQWMIPDHQGIVMGTAQGEWLVQSSANNDPITPTSCQAHNVTKIGNSLCEPRRAGVAIAFVQRFGKKVMEYVCDLFSSKFAGLNLSKRARHLTDAGIAELAYQQELIPILWARTQDNKLIGTTYKRESLMISQPPEFNGWHRHDLGSGFDVVALAEGASPSGLLDSISVITQDPATGYCRVEVLTEFFDETSTIDDAWFLDCATVPLGAVPDTVSMVDGIRFCGITHLEGKLVTAFVGRLNLGQYTVTDGQIFVPYMSDPDKRFTLAYMQSIASDDYTYGTEIQVPQTQFVQTIRHMQPELDPSILGQFTYLNYGDEALVDWKNDRATFLLPNTLPVSGLVQYKISDGSFIQYVTIDRVFGVPMPPSYDNGLAYPANPVVLGSDGNIWFAIVPNSLGVDPTSSGQTNWVDFLHGSVGVVPSIQWSNVTTYSTGQYVWGGISDNNIYRSLQNTNTNHVPASSPTFWQLYFPVPGAWSPTVQYGALSLILGSNQHYFYAIQPVPAGQGDPNTFALNNNPYWATQGGTYAYSITRTGLAIDSEGDIYMYEGGNFPIVKISGDTLTQIGFMSAFPGQTVPVPENMIAVKAYDNSLKGFHQYLVMTCNTDPAGTTTPSAVIIDAVGLIAATVGTVHFDEGNFPIVVAGVSEAGFASTFVLTNKVAGNAATTPLGLYEIDIFSSGAVGFTLKEKKAFRIDPNVAAFGDTFPTTNYYKRKIGTVNPTLIDPHWTFFNGFTGLMYDQKDNHVITFASTTNPSGWSSGTAYVVGGATLTSYALGSDNKVYHYTSAPAAWLIGTTYAMGNLVTGSDLKVYTSVAGGNTGHNPVGDGGVHWTLTGIDPTTDAGVHWTLIGSPATQLNYLVKLSTADASVIWSIPVTGAVTSGLSMSQVNIKNGAYVFLEGLGGGNWQGRYIETLTGQSSIFASGGSGFDQLGATQTYNDATGDVVMFPQYTVGGSGSPTPDPGTGNFTGWGVWNITRPYTPYIVSAIVGFPYVSQGQILSPSAPQEAGSRNGPGFGKTKRTHRYSIKVANTSDIKVGTDFNKLNPVLFASKGSVRYTPDQLYTGIWSAPLTDDYEYESMLCWQASGPYPAVMLAYGGFIHTQDR